MIPSVSLSSLASQTESFQERLLREAEAEAVKARQEAERLAGINAGKEKTAALTMEDYSNAQEESAKVFDIADNAIAISLADQFGLDLNLLGKQNFGFSFGGK